MAILSCLFLIIVLFVIECFTHQQPSFHDATQQQHHNQHSEPLKSANIPNQNQQHTQQFGGEQAKDERYKLNF